MAKTTELSVDQRKDIVALYQSGLGYDRISKETKVKKCTVQKIIQKWKKTGSCINRTRSGRPRKTTDRVDRNIIRRIKARRAVSAPKITAEIKIQFGIDVSPQTIRNRIHEAGFHSRTARKKPFISKKNRAARLKWAQDHIKWQILDWRKVLFSDESKFNLFGSDGVQRVWRKPGEEMNTECLRKTIKHGGGSVMVWGCMSYDGVGTMTFIDSILTKEGYINILESNLFRSVEKLGIADDFIFQQDKDPKHTAKIVTKWFEDKQIKVLPWAAQSPDFNPIEHLWAELERRIAGRNPSSKEEFKTLIKAEWEKLGGVVTKSLVESMPRRCQMAIQSKGGPTKY